MSNRNDLITLKFKPSQLIIIISLVTFLLGLLIGFFIWGNNSQPEQIVFAPTQENDPSPTESDENTSNPTNTSAPTAGTPSSEESDEVTRFDVPVDDDPFLGDEDAPITIIKFSDYQCPACSYWHNEIFHPLMEEYGDVIRFVYRDFPLSRHPQAIPAAEAANCAGDQGYYWDYHDKLFTTEQALSAELYVQLAEELNLEMESFNECVETRKYLSEVQADYDSAREWGVKGSPTFFLNGISFVGVKSFEFFSAMIEDELARLSD